MTGLDYLLFDADNHYYETPDCFSRYMNRADADRAITARRTERGGWSVMVGDHPYCFMDVKFDKTNPPGSMHESASQEIGLAGGHLGGLLFGRQHVGCLPTP